eukprot:2818707-Pyramimonas_sp.AAC.1
MMSSGPAAHFHPAGAPRDLSRRPEHPLGRDELACLRGGARARLRRRLPITIAAVRAGVDNSQHGEVRVWGNNGGGFWGNIAIQRLLSSFQLERANPIGIMKMKWVG